MKLSFLFSTDELNYWQRLIEKVQTEEWWDDFVEAIEENRHLSEEKQRQIAQSLSTLFSDFVVLPLGSRLFPPMLVNDLISKYVLEVTGKSVEEFHEVGRQVSENILANNTYLLVPKPLFELKSCEDVALWALASALHIGKNQQQAIAAMGRFVSPLMQQVSENDDLAEIFMRYGLIDPLEDDTYIVHFDRIIIALGDPQFLDEVAPYLSEGLPAEFFYGKQSIFAYAISLSLVNSLTYAAIVAKLKNLEDNLRETLEKVSQHLQELESELSKTEPDWDKVTELTDEIFIHINRLVKKGTKGEGVIPQIVERSRTVGVYPDIAMEALLALDEASVTEDEWKWLLATQNVALSLAGEAEPINRQPLYWVSLTLARVSTMPDSLEKKVKAAWQKLRAA